MAANPDAAGFGVYVHWPFCASKCPYCDFNSHVRSGGIDEARFRDATLREIAHWAARLGPRRVTSIFFGGGTPSLMAPETVAAILDAIPGAWSVAPDAEVTLEANPSSVEASRFRGYRAAGINRVSLGVQSLQDAQLRSLGRLHNAREARAAITIAAQTFERTSFDLIYARPGQTPQDWREELRAALGLAKGHLSLYQLTIEPETPFAELHRRGRLLVPDPDAAHALFAITQEECARVGMPAYEISNHARPGDESRHNLLYWRYGEYAGIGAGAHGRVIADGVRHATSNERKPEGWLDRVEASGAGTVECEPLTGAEQVDEALLMGLRLAEGIDLTRLLDLGGLVPSEASIAELIDLGLIERCGPSRLRAASAGRFVLNELVLRLSAALEPAGRPSSGPEARDGL